MREMHILRISDYSKRFNSTNLNLTGNERDICYKKILKILTRNSNYKCKTNDNKKGLVRTFGGCTVSALEHKL